MKLLVKIRNKIAIFLSKLSNFIKPKKVNGEVSPNFHIEKSGWIRATRDMIINTVLVGGYTLLNAIMTSPINWHDTWISVKTIVVGNIAMFLKEWALKYQIKIKEELNLENTDLTIPVVTTETDTEFKPRNPDIG